MPQYSFPELGIKSKEIQKESIEEQTLLLLTGPKRTIAELVKIHNTLYMNPVNIRELYQVIRNLREAGCPIVGDSGGLWIARNQSDIEAFAKKLEGKAKADIQSMMTLRKTMLSMIRSNTPSIFDTLTF